MIEAVVLGVLQGVFEWLPVSSEGVTVLTVVSVFKSSLSLEAVIRFSLFLHLGTFLAAIVYLRDDVACLLKALVRYRAQGQETQAILRFLVISTLVTGIVGGLIFFFVDILSRQIEFTASLIILAIGTLLLVTAWLQLKKKDAGLRDPSELTDRDGVVLGLFQGLAVLPGMSRSGLTVAALLLKKFKEEEALRLSFLMSLPVVLVGNIVLNLSSFSLTGPSVAALAASFLFGIATIHWLFKLARRVNFGWFVLIFGLLTIFAAFL